MSKYEDANGSAFDEFERVPRVKKNLTAETLVTYEKHYMDLLKRYMPEITEINTALEKVRAERNKFYTQDLPNVIQTLDSQGVSEAEKKIWLNELRENMERSFNMSESLISHYVTKNLDEFETELKRLLDRV